MSEKIDDRLKEIHTYIKSMQWQLVEAVFDYKDSWDGLYTLSEKLKGIDIILIYSIESISDDFAVEFIYKIAENENVVVKKY
ncbi:hypothetical protein KHA96_08390 [Bacillus sp. FJAT-49711]|uniref:hypothetical protein n=1 Tax=Bacillus sp. FJAT-49711 TaxID=2833585 RepID=UPI001BC96B17|nr:hypothetical protein [Bacillus sp. FJAT-49711]MBS4218328.1 hypothetical protein [Bacillus sp. FJAT-49711]